MKKIILYVLGFVVVIGVAGAGWYYYNFQKYAPESYVADIPVTSESKVEKNVTTSTTTPPKQVTVNTTTGATTPGSPTFTMVDVATHKDITSCYSVISGQVYDLTMWVNLHPGGKEAILKICGVDGTERFMKKHKGGEKFMTILARYKVGTLTQ